MPFGRNPIRLWLRCLTGGPPEAEIRQALALTGIDCDAGPGEAEAAGLVCGECVDEARELLADARARGCSRLIAATSERIEPEASFSLLGAGASDVLVWDRDAAPRALAARLERWANVDALLGSPEVRSALVGSSPAWLCTLRQIVEVAAFSDASILLLGATGTGKERVASLIHALDGREDKRELVVVDCTTLAPELAGSELFGHEKGAFTGAVVRRDGALALAHGGTLFLDEIGELPSPLQAQLLRAVQERLYKPVGSNTWYRTRFRLVCATHRDLCAEVAAGTFRRDLFHRISTWVFRLPSLRERPQDILPLASHFACEGLNGEPAEFDPAVQSYLVRRDYPGNVRELRQLVARMIHRHVGPGPITVGAIPPDDRPAELTCADWRDERLEGAIQRALSMGVGLKEIGRGATDLAVRLVVEQEQGNLQRAARKLGVTDRALQLRRGPARRDEEPAPPRKLM